MADRVPGETQRGFDGILDLTAMKQKSLVPDEYIPIFEKYHE